MLGAWRGAQRMDELVLYEDSGRKETNFTDDVNVK